MQTQQPKTVKILHLHIKIQRLQFYTKINYPTSPAALYACQKSINKPFYLKGKIITILGSGTNRHSCRLSRSK